MNHFIASSARLTAALTMGLAALAHAQSAPQAGQSLITAQSQVGFVIKQMGVPVEGQFRKFDAQIAFDPAKLASSRIAFNIDVGSASLGSREADAEMPKAVCFTPPSSRKPAFSPAASKRWATGASRWRAN
jgi:polyisoprenoid-binding protein YceI